MGRTYFEAIEGLRTFSIHPAAELFPVMNEAEINELATSIMEHGLRDKVVIMPTGEVLDGRNRIMAHYLLEKENDLVYEEFTGDDPIQYVFDKNILRRHLKTNVKAAIAAEMLPMIRADLEAKKAAGDVDAHVRARDIAADIMGVGGRTVGVAEEVMLKAPDLHEEVKAGNLSVNAALEKTKERSDLTNGIRISKEDRITEGLVAKFNKFFEAAFGQWPDSVPMDALAAHMQAALIRCGQRDKYLEEATREEA